MGPPTGSLTLLSPLSPPSLSRAWLTAPHPTLPLAATCSSDKSVRIYSLTSFTLLSTISGGHKRSVRSCAWQPGVKGESVLATGSFDASVGVWKRWNREEMNPRPDEPVDYTGSGAAVEEGNSEDNKDEDEEWRFALVLDGHDSEVKSVAWSAGGNLLATCSRDKSVWVWEEVGEEDFETVAVLQEHGGDVKCVSWHPEEELLASASYDDEVRLWREEIDDWGCVAVLRGHKSTVWGVEWEGLSVGFKGEGIAEQEEWIKRKGKAGPRLVSCSDDLSIRVWRRRPREKGPEQSKLSIIRTGSNDEDWVEEARLPHVHERAIYSVAWSKTTGRIVSSGGDGKVAIYEERWRHGISVDPSIPNGCSDGEGKERAQESDVDKTKGEEEATEWIVVAELEAAHGDFEVNHICWARRADRGKRHEDEEVVVSTGDDGVANVWMLDI